MMTKRPRLGRGLDALLGAEYPAGAEKDELKQLPLEVLSRGRYQPRTRMDKGALEELAASIKAQGVVQPIVVRAAANGNYEIIAGERRWRAAQLAGLETIPAVVRRVPDEAAVAISLIENIQRENLNPVEEAGALHRLIEEFGMTHQQVAQAVGRSRAAVTNLLRLLALTAEVRRLLEDGRLDMGHARALLAIEGDLQTQVAREVAERRLSVRETEERVRRMLARPAARKARRSTDPDIRNLQQRLSEKLGAKVRVRHGRGGKGQVTVYYQSLDELDGILQRIR